VKKIGLYFGSFNPIHNGHLAIAKFFQNVGGLSEVWMVVSPQNPLKKPSELAPQEERWQMVQIALRATNTIRACDIEFSLPKPSYTIQTLDVLKEKYPSYQFVLLMGEDSLAGMENWKAYKRLLTEFELYVFHRKEAAEIPSSLSLDNVTFFRNADPIPLSSTAIRAAIARGEDVTELLPTGVAFYILEKGLYR
jgi:nicotinate-nucleotide adenylyltransferase